MKPTEPQDDLPLLLMGVLGAVVGDLAVQSQRHRLVTDARAQRNHVLTRHALAQVRTGDGAA
jgi:hypothetical protein